MEKRRKTKIRKWDEVGGATEIEVVEAGSTFDETPGAGPSISQNPMRGIEDMVEQNDNSFDGIINNLPEEKTPAQMVNEDVIEAEQQRKSVLKKLQECAPEPEKVKAAPGCNLCGDLERF